MKRALLIIALLLFFVPNVTADYYAYTTYGNDGGLQRNILGNTALNYTSISPNIANTGSFAEAITFDYDNNGVTDIVLQGSGNNVFLVEGDQLTINSDSKELGVMSITGVACDIQNTGTTRQYVGIFQNSSGTHFLTVLNISNRRMTVVTQKITNTTNLYGNILCNNFYSTEGDTKNYLFWLDATKNLHKAYMTGTTIVETISDPEGGVAKETAGTYTFNGGSHTIAYSDDFDEDGKKALAYTAGDYIIGVLSDGDEFSHDWQGDVALTGTFQAQSRLHILGDIQTGNARKAFIVIPATNLPNGGNNYVIALLYEEGGLFTNTFTLLQRLAHANPAGLNNAFEIAPAIHDYNYDLRDDVYIIISAGLGNTGILVYSSNNLSTNTPMSGTGFQSGYTMPTNGYPPRIYVMQNGNIIVTTASSGGSVISRSRLTNYSDAGIRVIGSMPSGTLNTINFYAPQPIALNNDGDIDFLYSSAAATRFYVSGGVSQTTVNYPFTATLNSTPPLAAVAKITALFNTNITQGVYNYAGICDTSEVTIYNEQFNLNYNFTNRNVSTSAPIDPENYLTYYGYSFPTNITYFDVRKFGNVGVRDILKQTIAYTSSAPNVMLYFAYASDFTRTYTLKLNYTGSIVIVSEFSDPTQETYITNYSITSGINAFSITYTPQTDLGNGIDYFTTEIMVGNTTVGTGNTYKYYFPGTNIKDTELYTDTPNTTITLSNIGLFKTKDSTPTFSQFQNGQIIVNNDITFTNPPPQDYIVGDGFTVIPDYNDKFYVSCSYQEEGKYTQRHFIAPINVVNDYSNYEDLTVTVTVTGEAVVDEGQSGIDNPPAGENVITSFFQDVGVTDQATAFVAWIFLSVVVAGFAFALHPAFGILTFVALMMLGVYIGMMPLWVIILFVIIAGGIFVTVYRNITSGT